MGIVAMDMIAAAWLIALVVGGFFVVLWGGNG